MLYCMFLSQLFHGNFKISAQTQPSHLCQNFVVKASLQLLNTNILNLTKMFSISLLICTQTGYFL